MAIMDKPELACVLITVRGNESEYTAYPVVLRSVGGPRTSLDHKALGVILREIGERWMRGETEIIFETTR